VLTTLISFLVVIGVLVFVHELGHLLAAKSVDIECPRFSIGFGPRIAGFRIGETEYVISLLPLGGYVRMAGMEDTAALEGGADPDHTPSERDFDSKPLLARVWVVTAGVIMNFIFAIVVITGVSLVWGEQVNRTTRIAVATKPPLTAASAPLAQVPLGATIVAVGDRPVRNWGEVTDALTRAPAGPSTIRFRDAAPVTLDLPADLTGRMAVLSPIQAFNAPVIGEVSTGTPAQKAGLAPGDVISAVNGQPIRVWSEFVERVRASPGKPLLLDLVRGGERRVLQVTPEMRRDTDAELKRVQIGWLGVASRTEFERHRLGPVAALKHGVGVTWSTSSSIVKLLGDLFTGKASPRSLGGPLTIGQISGQTARAGVEVLLQWMALLSVNLAVLNLLPIPVLDGGQLLFLIVEGLRGRPMSLEQRLRLSHVGLILVVGLMVWAIANDFLRLFGI
jgi:regulator of sigma E protease